VLILAIVLTVGFGLEGWAELTGRPSPLLGRRL